MITSIFLISSQAEMHDEVGVVEAERLGDAQQISILVDEADLAFVMACLDYACVRQNDEL